MPLCRSILVVDDNQNVRQTIEEALDYEGYQVRGAKNGEEAHALLKSLEAPTLIFLDLMMPEMNGWEFLEKFQDELDRNHHQVVTISAVEAVRSFEDPTPLPSVAKLRKPFTLEALSEIVEQFCVIPEDETPAHLKAL